MLAGKTFKTIIVLILVLAMTFVMTACGKISADKAKDIALKELGLSIITTSRIDAEYDESTSPATYKVIIYQAEVNQIVIVDANSGAVLSHTTEDAGRY